MIVSTISEKVDKSDVESISAETIKDESGLSLSRAYSVTSEPPEYKKPTSSSVRIARLIAVTVVAVALILGTAIILAAYLQTRHNSAPAHFVAAPASSTETNKVVTAALPSALTGDAPNGVGESSSSESSSEVPDDETDHRRLDTDGDLLEEFLENEGKILRLPTGSDLDIDIDELTKMFMKRNPLDKSKCVVERRPIDGADDFVKVLPITAKNATAVPVMPVISGERISIICSSDDIQQDLDEDLIQSKPISPFGLRPPMRINPFGSMGPINSMSVIGPIPLMMNAGHMMNPMMFSRTMNPPLPLSLTPPPFDLNNALLLEQRAFNVPQPMRSPFQGFPAGRPFPGQMRPLGPSPFSQQFQSFPPPRPFEVPTEKRFNFPFDLPDNSQEKSHVPEHHMNSEPEILITSTRPTPIFRERQPSPILPDFPGLLGLLEDLPDIIGEEPKSEERLSVQPGKPELPTFRIPKFLLNAPGPNVRVGPVQQPAVPIPQPTGPVTLPFLQVPPLPAALAGKERSAPTPVNIPFLNVRSAVSPPTPVNPTPAAERRQSRSFLERLMDSILVSSNNRQSKSMKPSTDAMPVRPDQPAIRTGGRGLRMPEERKDSIPDGIIVARPIGSVADEDVAHEQDSRARSHHFIQPRSLKVN